MKLDVLNIQGEKTGRQVELSDDIFGIEPNEHAVYLSVKQYLANQRQGTHKAKERHEISGSTRKLHKQKGTGGSRKGDINSPLFKGGARVFGPRPRNYSFQLNKKLKRLARKSVLAAKVQEGNLFVIEDFAFDQPKTKSFLDILTKLNIQDKKSLMVTGDYEKMVYLSSRNLPKVSVSRAEDINTYDVLNATSLVLCESSLGKIEESLAN